MFAFLKALDYCQFNGETAIIQLKSLLEHLECINLLESFLELYLFNEQQPTRYRVQKQRQ
jgi:hypothetical protein